MTDVFLDFLPSGPDESGDERESAILREIQRLNGKPNIHQMLRLAEWVRERSGVSRPAEDYQAEYEHRLGALIQRRLTWIGQGDNAAEHLMVPGARALIEMFHASGVGLSIATGTPRVEVEKELRLLGLDEVFRGRLFAPNHGGDRGFSKRASIRSILEDFDCDAHALLALGDGPIEIAETKQAGGLAIGVASDEDSPDAGQFDLHKYAILQAAGADAVIANYRSFERWLAPLLRS